MSENMTEAQIEQAIHKKRIGHVIPPRPEKKTSHFKHKVEKGMSGLLVCRNCKVFL